MLLYPAQSGHEDMGLLMKGIVSNVFPWLEMRHDFCHVSHTQHKDKC